MNHVCYFFEFVTYREAADKCNSIGMKLLTFENSSIYSDSISIINMMKDASFWINGQGGPNFIESDGVTPIDTSLFSIDTTYDGTCLSLSVYPSDAGYHKVYTQHCNTLRNFVCDIGYITSPPPRPPGKIISQYEILCTSPLPCIQTPGGYLWMFIPGGCVCLIFREDPNSTTTGIETNTTQMFTTNG